MIGLPAEITEALDGYLRLVRAADGHAYNGDRRLAQEWDTEADKAREELELRILNAISGGPALGVRSTVSEYIDRGEWPDRDDEVTP